MSAGNKEDDIKSIPAGKKRLIEAALKIAAKNGELTTIGIRELAREAGLNPNTFYRHFDDMEDLGLTAISALTDNLRKGLKNARRRAGNHTDATEGSARFFFDFVDKQPDAFTVGIRAINGSSEAISKAMHSVLDEIADDVAKGIHALGLADKIPEDSLDLISHSIVEHLFYKSVDYIQKPDQRDPIRKNAVQFSRMLFLGAQAMKHTQ